MKSTWEPDEGALAAAVDAICGLKRPLAVHDPFARLTPCRWSARKRRAVRPDSTLYRWVAAMKRTDPDAWAVLVEAGVRVDGYSARLRGAPATGAQLVATLRGLQQAPSVRSYTRTCCAEALKRLAQIIVHPGAWGSRLIGASFNNEGVALFRRGRVRVGVAAPPSLLRLGEVAKSPEAFADLACLAVDFPDLLRAAVWGLAVEAEGDRKHRARAAMGEITAALRDQLPTGRALPVPPYYGADELRARGLGEAVGTLEQLVWPPTVPNWRLEPLKARLDNLAAGRRSPLPPTTAWALAH